MMKTRAVGNVKIIPERHELIKRYVSNVYYARGAITVVFDTEE